MKAARPLTLVIIDDSAEVREALGEILDEESDLTLLDVASGVSEGIESVIRLQPDVVVLDVNMPDGGGLRAAREIAAALPEVRIIAFSAFDKMLIRKTMTAAGAEAYISKSADISELLDAIRGNSGAGANARSYL